MYILNVYIIYFIYNKIMLFIYNTSFVKKNKRRHMYVWWISKFVNRVSGRKENQYLTVRLRQTSLTAIHTHTNTHSMAGSRTGPQPQQHIRCDYCSESERETTMMQQCPLLKQATALRAEHIHIWIKHVSICQD